jgi:Auxin responsive protein
MIHPKKLIEMARKWHKKSTDKGHFVVYTIDGERFMIPLSFLNSKIFEELLKMSEDEFGLSNDGPIVIPCDASLVRHMISLIGGQKSQELERKSIESLMSQAIHNPLFLHVVGFSQQEAVC